MEDNRHRLSEITTNYYLLRVSYPNPKIVTNEMTHS